jgi:hypothetical protein
MKQNNIIIIAAVLALVLSVGIFMRVQSEKTHFDKTVKAALATSEGYDQKFIDMVNRLEQELAQRASFGYTGGKDPMTGTMRRVVQASAEGTGKGSAVVKEQVYVDPVKLTAIIADASGRKITAVVMDGERSYSVEQGDIVAGRKITRITNEGVFMENDSINYFYDIFGKKEEKLKEGFGFKR